MDYRTLTALELGALLREGSLSAAGAAKAGLDRLAQAQGRSNAFITVTKEDTDIEARLRAGASILNVAAGPRTPDVVRLIREKNPQVPIIASGGKTGESIRQTIAAGANAITFTPPSTQELFKEMMERYRE